MFEMLPTTRPASEQQATAPAQSPAQPPIQNRRGRGRRRANEVTSSSPAFWVWITYSLCLVHLKFCLVSLPFRQGFHMFI